ncbi:MAG: xanthine dehydrogenase small subunit [Povalibacter sp.]
MRILLDGQVIDAANVPATTTVLEYLRDTLHRTGTKEGCAEGDCGACTIVLGELSATGDRIEYKPVNSCIRYLPTIDGRELITVESLHNKDSLHPVQQSMVDQHASQCGFCTPGFVMSLFGLYLEETAPGRDDVIGALAGNLCRCTGYRPIVDAGCSMNRYPEPSHWSRSDAQSTSRKDALRSLQRTSSLKLPDFVAPQTMDELASILVSAPDSLVLAGGTDIGLWTTKQLKTLPKIVYLGEVRELKQISLAEDQLSIGAAVTLSDAWKTIVHHYPTLKDLARRFASPPVCNSGTLCGNIANGSPIGDSMPALIALGATIELRRGVQTRSLPLEDFYLGYQRKDLQPGEFVVRVTVPLPRSQQLLACYKISKRFDQDISAVCGAFCVEIQDEKVISARIAFGGMAPIPKRAVRTEQSLIGKAWDSNTIDAAVETLEAEFQPLSDMRASAAYRLESAGNLLRKFHRASQGESALSVHELAVMS